jgi:hypothetical protein
VALLVYGTVMIFLQTEAALKLLGGVMGYGGWMWGGFSDLPTAWSAPTDVDAPMRVVYSALTLRQSLLPWLAWVWGIILLLWMRRPTGTEITQREQPATRNLLPVAFVLSALALSVALGAGGWLRGSHTLPMGGQWPGSNYDEMVYYTEAELLTRGVIAYRDTFMPHPPGIIWAFAPALVLETPWGGPDAFVAARQWLFAYSLLALPLIWVCGRKLGGNWSGAIAVLVLALDGKAAFAPESDRKLPNVGTLETLVNLWSLAALAVYLYAPEGSKRRWWMVGAGALAGVAAMCKVPGIALVGALLVYTLASRRVRDALWIAIGAGLGALLLALPFLVVAPGQMIRQAIFFQLLRPQEVREGVDQASRIATYPEAQVTLLLAGLGIVVIAGILLARRGWDEVGVRWALPVLWAAPIAAVFLLGRSYHTQYYTQWVPALALIASALGANYVWERVTGTKIALAGLLALVALPLVVSQWRAATSEAYDTVYRPAGQTLAQRLQRGFGQAMAFDPGYTLAAGVPPARIPSSQDNGYIVDTAALTVYTAEQIDRRPWGDLIRSALAMNRERNEADVLKTPEAQGALLAGAVGANQIVLDQKIAIPKLTAQSVHLLEGLSTSREDIGYATVLAMGSVKETEMGVLHMSLAVSVLSPLLEGQTSTVLSGTVRVQQNGVVQIGLYWRPSDYPAGDYRVVVRLAGADGQTARQADTEPSEGMDHTSAWRPGFVYPDIRNIPLEGIPPGRYSVMVRTYDPKTNTSSQDVQLPQSIEIK